MKVKDILEILKIPQEKLFKDLSNVDIEADLETDVPNDVVKKLSKKYGVNLKPVKAKKEPVVKVKITPPKEQPVAKEEPEKKAVEEKPVEVKKESKPEVKPQPVTAEEGAEKKKPTKKQEPKKQAPSVEAEEPEKTPIPEIDVELTRVYDDSYNDYVQETKEYTRLKNIKKKQKGRQQGRQSNIEEKKTKENILYFVPGMTVAQIADGLGLGYGEIVRKLIDLGFMVSATQSIDRDIVELLAEDSGFTLKNKVSEDITKFEEIVIEDDEKSLVPRPAVVTIMGHVDHGKTTLLDTIRNTRVVAGEAGGITQHIGAYQVKKKGKTITFIDTPGHAAFTEMRARGAQLTDIVILVVAADDGVMPQTKEAIEHAQAAKVPIIVAINKMDKPTANPDRVKQELVALNLIPEEWGGSTIFVPISALTGKGVDDLLEMVVLTADIENYRANPNRLGMGIVIEAKLDKGRGPVATFLVKNGTIKIGDPIVVGNTYGKIRAMQDETKASLKSAGPSKAVEVTGLVDVPQAGDSFMVFEDERTTRLISEERSSRAFDIEMGVGKEINLKTIFEKLDDSQKELNLIIKGDVQGSIEALRNSLEKVEVEGVKINVVRCAVGAITETDITLAVASGAIIIGFNIRPNAATLKLASEKKIEIRLYNIIYKVLEDIQAAMVGMLDPVFEEKVTGEAEVRTIFKASKVGTIAGCYIANGYITRNSDIRLIRDSIVIYEGKLSSLKRFKDDVKEVKFGYECGMTIENYNDIKEGDIIEAYVMEKVKQ
ncbi:MAG TPA: translation initiation factor IF-2 [Bacilli bacterium]|jgi:translation initiation factor IF-2|nr:translation initiation factor IF-2 [Bacilli bacterium]HOD60637.1 translation initiation factor IF-2 [Bacilli bacterium]HOH60970.1 translation initiation factor IF-2 [Bacilli bacterium]HPB48901.1 translation initiation factor IF-2 [Bacilli bacterium]HPM15124.1 translation initiation factor IF-2 [Bacilli bacterium]